MQLNSIKGTKLLPLTVSAAMFASSAFAINYTELENHSNINVMVTSPVTNNYLNLINDSEYKNVVIKLKFQELYSAWKKQTMFNSKVSKIVNNENFKEIVLLGKPVVPFIVNEIDREPSFLVWTLNYIFNTTISTNPNTTIEESCKLWVRRLNK
jgi:hypothetical protein